MKSLVAGIVFILLIGIGGFVYRNVQEHVGVPPENACTADAKLCPDGSAVGRIGPTCTFAPCVFPNVEFSDIKLSFVLPAGYVKGVQEPGADGEVPGMIDFYQKPAEGDAFHYITIYRYPIKEGEKGEEVLIKSTIFSPSGEQAKDMNVFKPVIVNGKTFESVVTERFEGQVVSSYYLIREQDVLRFDVLEKDVQDWTDAKLVVQKLPEHSALLKMLATVQTP